MSETLPLWQKIYEVLTTLAVDDVLTYATLDELADKPFRDTSRDALYTACRAFEKRNARTLTAIPRVGYRVCAASEHAGLARSHHRKSLTQLRKSLEKIACTDVAQLTAPQRRALDTLELHLHQQGQMVWRLSTRLQKVEQHLDLRKEVERALTQRLDLLQAVLRERQPPQPAEEQA